MKAIESILAHRASECYTTECCGLEKPQEIPNTGMGSRQRRERAKPTFIAVDSGEARFADTVVASDAIGAHGPVQAGLLQTLVPIWRERRERPAKRPTGDTV